MLPTQLKGKFSDVGHICDFILQLQFMNSHSTENLEEVMTVNVTVRSTEILDLCSQMHPIRPELMFTPTSYLYQPKKHKYIHITARTYGHTDTLFL